MISECVVIICVRHWLTNTPFRLCLGSLTRASIVLTQYQNVSFFFFFKFSTQNVWRNHFFLWFCFFIEAERSSSSRLMSVFLSFLCPLITSESRETKTIIFSSPPGSNWGAFAMRLLRVLKNHVNFISLLSIARKKSTKNFQIKMFRITFRFASHFPFVLRFFFGCCSINVLILLLFVNGVFYTHCWKGKNGCSLCVVCKFSVETASGVRASHCDRQINE